MNALETLRALPYQVAEEAMNHLLDYDDVTIIFEYGRYNVSPHVMISNQYAKDRKYIGNFKAVEIYPNEKERTALRRMRDTHTERMAEILLNQNNRPSCNHDLLKVAIDLKSYEW